jgi:hypothetical protein
MSYRITTGRLLAFLSLLPASWGCPSGPARIKPPAISASKAGAMAVEMYDSDKDGKISGAELEKCPALKSAIARIDHAGEGITAAKIAARIEAWQNSRAALMAISCVVLHNGRPLAGAEVKFVPEKFLGENIKVAAGKTDENGHTWPTIPINGPEDRPGLAPGFYRIEVTKPGMNIPSKYNTETILGEEVAPDCQNVMGGYTYDLKF